MACVVAVVVQLLGNGQRIRSTPEDFYSTDDGKTFFVAAGTNVPPFDYKGQTALRAHVFECDGVQFVGYLDRYKPDVRKKVEAGERIPLAIELAGREVKTPGSTNWITCSNTMEMSKLTGKVECPGKPGKVPVPIVPD